MGTASVLGITLFVVIIVRLNKRRPGPSGANQRGSAPARGSEANDAPQSQQRRGARRVIVSAVEVLVSKEAMSLGATMDFLPGARDALVELCRTNDVYFVATVSDEKHADAVRQF